MDLTNKKRAEALSIISSACAQNIPLDLSIIETKVSTAYRSRFLILDESQEDPALVIEAPTSKANVVLVRPGQDIRISFVIEERHHVFSTKVLGRGKFRLNPNVIVPSLELAIPESIASGKRRRFYRLPISDTTPIEVGLGILASEKGGTQRIRSREKGFLTDIGGGGLGFRIPEGRSLLLGVDTRLLLTFSLPAEEEPIRMLGRICYTVRRPEFREILFGVQFTEVESVIEYKQNVDKILHFVAERQRMSLSNRVDINR